MTEKPRESGTGASKAGLQEAVGTWLSKQGLPLELRVARMLERQGLHVLPNRFVDVPGRRRPREIDALALIQRNTPFLRARFELYVECKWSRGNPWVVFTSSGPPPPISVTLQAVPANTMGGALLWLLQDSTEFAGLVPFGPPAVLAHGGKRTMADPGGVDRFYAAMQSVSTVTHAGVHAAGVHSLAMNPDRDPVFGFPLVVVDGPLFSASLKEDTDDLALTAIERARVLWHGLRAERLSCVDVVQASALEAYARDCVQGLKDAFDRLGVVHSDVCQALRAGSPDPMSHWFHGRTTTPLIKVPTLLLPLATEYARAQEERAQQLRSGGV